MSKFITKLEKIEAIQFNGENTKEYSEFMKGYNFALPAFRNGDWIAKNSEGKIMVYSNQAFLSKYEEGKA